MFMVTSCRIGRAHEHVLPRNTRNFDGEHFLAYSIQMLATNELLPLSRAPLLKVVPMGFAVDVDKRFHRSRERWHQFGSEAISILSPSENPHPRPRQLWSALQMSSKCRSESAISADVAHKSD